VSQLEQLGVTGGLEADSTFTGADVSAGGAHLRAQCEEDVPLETPHPGLLVAGVPSVLRLPPPPHSIYAGLLLAVVACRCLQQLTHSRQEAVLKEPHHRAPDRIADRAWVFAVGRNSA